MASSFNRLVVIGILLTTNAKRMHPCTILRDVLHFTLVCCFRFQLNSILFFRFLLFYFLFLHLLLFPLNLQELIEQRGLIGLQKKNNTRWTFTRLYVPTELHRWESETYLLFVKCFHSYLVLIILFSCSFLLFLSLLLCCCCCFVCFAEGLFVCCIDCYLRLWITSNVLQYWPKHKSGYLAQSTFSLLFHHNI